MWTTREEREEAKKQAMDQISSKFKEAGVEITDNLITDVVQRITVLGPHEVRHKLMSEQVEEAVGKILSDNPGLKNFTVDICEILENLASTPEAKQVLQGTFLPVKADSVQEKNKLEAAEALKTVQGMMDEIAGDTTIRSNIGYSC